MYSTHEAQKDYQRDQRLGLYLTGPRAKKQHPPAIKYGGVQDNT